MAVRRTGERRMAEEAGDREAGVLAGVMVMRPGGVVSDAAVADGVVLGVGRGAGPADCMGVRGGVAGVEREPPGREVVAGEAAVREAGGREVVAGEVAVREVVAAERWASSGSWVGRSALHSLSTVLSGLPP